MKEGPLVQMLDRQRVHQAAADEAKKVVDAAALAAERLSDATKEAEETATAAAAAARGCYQGLSCSSHAFSLQMAAQNSQGNQGKPLPGAPKTLSVNSCRRNPPQDAAREG